MLKFNLKLIIIFSLIAIFFSIGFIRLWKGIYLPKSNMPQKEIIFNVAKGQGLNAISGNLEKQGIIKSDFAFKIYVIFSGFSKKLQAGDYLFSPSMAVPEIAGKIARGEVISGKITLLEGWDLSDIADYFKKIGLFEKEVFLSAVANHDNFSNDFDFLKDKPKDLGLEGYLFPDTYDIPPDKKLEDIIKMILDNFGRKLTEEMKEQLFVSQKSIFEIVTMASLIEKEVRGPEDKKLVSGILWKRLKAGMPLQVDSTILYITGRKSGKVSTLDTKIDSFYNTYKYKGLPLGPISNPGLESIMAAIYPKNSDFWYYLSAPDGKTIFSRTFKEHNKAVAKYLK